MKKALGRIILVALLLSLLTSIPASGLSPEPSQVADEVSTMFPRTGDTVVLEESPYWDITGDFAEGWRTFDDLPEAGRLLYDLTVEQNTLQNGGHADFALRINNQLVARFSVFESETSKRLSFSFPVLAGPDYKIYLELESDVANGEVQIPLDKSVLTLYPPGGCIVVGPASKAMDTSQVELLRRFRDELLASDPAMRERIDAYYTLTPEASAILASHPLLLARTARLLMRSQPGLQALLDGRGDEIVLPATDLRASYRLLDDVSKQASPELASALLELSGLIQQFEGRTLAEGWSAIVGF